MIRQIESFQSWYIATGGSLNSAASYATYLRRVDERCGGLDSWIARDEMTKLLEWMEQQPWAAFGSEKAWRDSRSALRKYAAFLDTNLDIAHSESTDAPAPANANFSTGSQADRDDIVALLREAKALGAKYYKATGKPLGVTGEVAELEAAERLGLKLCVARTAGFDAWRESDGKRYRIQIKGRAVDRNDPYRGRCPSIKCGNLFDEVILVLLDRSTLEALEIWSATEADIEARLRVPGSIARNDRNSLAITQFKSIAQRIWPLS